VTAIAIRPERGGDAPAIFALTEAAFQDMPYADGDEQQLVDPLRADAIWRCRWWPRMRRG
jgi:predicted N-acetyltransferase YhbS